jgi:HprK-related kinase A
MLKIGDLSGAQLRARLAGPGLRLRTGAFVASVRSPLAQVAEGIALLYGDYALADEHGFADFHLNLRPGRGLRRWLRPQVHVDVDGLAPFLPLPVGQAYSMFEWTMNWCVSTRAHGYLIIHAAVVEKNGRAAILPAPSGSGKSTLCAALVCRGWRLLSDELALISTATGQLAPVPRPISLKNASIGLIAAYASNPVFSRAAVDTAKGTIAHLKAPVESIRRAGEPARPAWIVFPTYAAGSAPQLAPLAPARAFLRVGENAFNYSLLGATGFATLAGLVGATRSFDFRYSALDDAVAVFDALAGGPA